MPTETITLKLIAQDLASGNINKAVGSIDKLAQKGGIAGSVLQGVGLSIGTMLNPVSLAATGIGALTDTIGDSINAASDLEESQAKVGEVFSDTAQSIFDWSQTSADAFGLSQQAALEAAGTFGNFIQALGGAEEESNEMSRTLVELSADLASFNNQSIDEVLVALRSGLAGETEPMRRLGVNISAARIQSLGLAKGLGGVNGKLSESEKVQLRYEAILEDTVKAQGDFERTSDGLANSQRILDARMKDLQARMGGPFADAASVAVGGLIGITEVVGALLGAGEQSASVLRLSEKMRALGDDLDNLGEDAEEASGQLGGLELSIIGTNAAIDTLVRSSQSGPNLATLFGEDVKRAREELGSLVDVLGLTDRQFARLVEEGRVAGGAIEDIIDTIRTDALQQARGDVDRLAEGYEGLFPPVVETRIANDRLGESLDTLGGSIGRVLGQFTAIVDKFAEFQDNAGDIAKTKSLTEINKEIEKQKRLLDEAAEANNVRKFAAAAARLAELEGQKQLRIAGREALNEHNAQQKERRQAIRDLAKQYGVSVGDIKRKLKNHEGDLESVRDGLEKTKGKAEEVGKTKVEPKVGLDATIFNRDMRLVIAKIAALDALSATVDVYTNFVRGALGQRALGGPVREGQAYIVGEQGPEVFVPRVSGDIVPNHEVMTSPSSPARGFGGVTVNINHPTFLGTEADAQRWAMEAGPALTRWMRRQGV